VSGELSRREALPMLAGIPLLVAGVRAPEILRAARAVREVLVSQIPFVPTFFTAHEYATVRVLAELVIPRDGRSGGALDAGVPEFMDFILAEKTGMQTRVRGGLAWLDHEAGQRHSHEFVDLADAERRRILDDIAWPAKARPEYAQGVAFFSAFRDLAASGFFSSQIGVADLQYLGNQVVAEWTGCPPEALAKLGVKYP
jgi:hypothetical protein